MFHMDFPQSNKRYLFGFRFFAQKFLAEIIRKSQRRIQDPSKAEYVSFKLANTFLCTAVPLKALEQNSHISGLPDLLSQLTETAIIK
jgi:hypothetical protein